MKLNAKQLRVAEEADVKDTLTGMKRHPIYFILENIYDTYNIGGLFRLADAITVEKIFLCGQTEIPPNAKIKKASIGTYKVVPWEYCQTAEEAIKKVTEAHRSRRLEADHADKNSPPFSPAVALAKEGQGGVPTRLVGGVVNEGQQAQTPSIIAVEQHPKAVEYTKINYQMPLALVFGNETYGVLPETLKLVDQIAEIPMWGVNKSLNVIVSAAIVSYHVMNKVKIS